METLKIAVVGPSLNKVPPDGYGSEWVLYRVAVNLVKMGHEVHLYAPYKKIKEDGIIRHPMKYTPSNIVLDAEAGAFDRDVENMDFILDGSASCIFHEFVHWKTKKHIPHACWRNGMNFSAPRIYRHNIVVLSELAKQYALEGKNAYEFPFYHKSIPSPVVDPVVIGYGISLSKKTCPHDEYYLWYSRFSPEKGFIEVLKMAKKNPREKFVLAGDAIYADHFFNFIIAKDLASSIDNVKLIPNPRDKDELLCKAKAFIYPVQYAEAFGLVLLEAARLSTPIIIPESSRKFITPELYPVIDNPSPKTIRDNKFTEKDMVDRWVSFIKKAVNGYETKEE